MIKKEKFYDNMGRPSYLLGLGEGPYMRYYLKENIHGRYEFWNCDFKLENLDYLTIRKSVLTEKEFDKLKKVLYIYHNSKDIATIYREIESFKDEEKAHHYNIIEIETENIIRKLLEP